MIFTVDSCYGKLVLFYYKRHFHRISRLSLAVCLHWDMSKAAGVEDTEGSPCPRSQQEHQPGGCSLLLDCWCPAAQGVSSKFHLQNPQFGLWALKMKWNQAGKAEVDISGLGFECSSLFKPGCGYECALQHHGWPSSPGCSY